MGTVYRLRRNLTDLISVLTQCQNRVNCYTDRKYIFNNNENVTAKAEGKRGTASALGLHGKILAVGRAARVASVRRHQGLPPCQTEPAPDGSKTDPVLPKAEPMTDSGGASVKISLLLDRFQNILSSTAQCVSQPPYVRLF